MKAIIILLLSLLFTSSIEATLDPCIVVVFGATGDLTRRKLLPALSQLEKEGALSPHTAFVGISTSPHSHDTFRASIASFWPERHHYIFYFNIEDENLKEHLSEIDQNIGTQGNRIYYLATPPSQFSSIIKKLHNEGLIYDVTETRWSRVVIEKPFGHDLNSALDLHQLLSTYLDPSQIYLMDHYLGKEGVQNLIKLRFVEQSLEPLWNHVHIEKIEITFAEEVGIGERGAFWEETGYLRDIFQNHIMQILTFVAMEHPSRQEGSSLKQEKLALLHAIRPFPLDNLEQSIIRGQYAGYREEKNVRHDSSVETFVAAQLFIDNDRWQGVPFYIRAGKRLPEQISEVKLFFKNNPMVCTIPIQPCRAHSPSREAYVTLLYDAIRGDKHLYVTAEEQLAAWRLVTPVLDYWKLHPETIEIYQPGTWGLINKW